MTYSNIQKKQIISSTVAFVKHTLKDAEAGHDWFHIERVWNIAKKISKTEKCDPFIVELGILLHDIADHKFHNGDETIGPRKTKEFLTNMDLDDKTISHVVKIVENVSFKGKNHKQEFKSPELDIVQDADRLDAMGAIGIARAFHYGGHKNRLLHDPSEEPVKNMTKKEYMKNNSSTINHFHEKLFHLKNMMNTATGKKMAKRRHEFMEKYHKEFIMEWKGKF